MKKTFWFLALVSIFVNFSLTCSFSKKLYTAHYKTSKHQRRSQLGSLSNNSSQQDTKKMLEDLYHRYPRKYSRVQPKRIEQDDFQ